MVFIYLQKNSRFLVLNQHNYNILLTNKTQTINPQK